MIVAHDDLDFLADLQGELRDYVVDELNVRELEVCDDPLKYATIKAEPNFAVLGKRLGKAMGAVGKGVKSMTEADIVAFQKSGVFAVGDNVLGADDIVVKREFRLPAGFTKEEMDAASGEENVMVIMELTADQSLIDSGAAREFVNRMQKLRKSSGLQASDSVSVFFEINSDADQEGSDSLLRMFASERSYLEESLGCVPQHVSSKPHDAEVIASGECSLSIGAEFVASLARLSL